LCLVLIGFQAINAHGDGWELNGDHYCCAECVAQDMGAEKRK
jgi:hypothetical protein